jgi:hypothetical protein
LSGGRANRLAEEPTRQIQERPSANGCQEQFANHLMLRGAATPRVVNDNGTERSELTNTFEIIMT